MAMVLVSHFSYRDVIKLLSKWPCPTSGPFVILTLNKATCTSWSGLPLVGISTYSRDFLPFVGCRGKPTG